MINALKIPIQRRSLLSGLTALTAVGFLPTTLAQTVADALDDWGNYTWAACVINCGNRCPLRVYSKVGKVIRIETDNTIKDGCRPRQIRACLKGRAMRQRLYSPDRLKYPMKRVGERGDAEFERISWDEAFRDDRRALEGNPREVRQRIHLLELRERSAKPRQFPPRLAASDEPDGRVSPLLRFVFVGADLRRLPVHLRKKGLFGGMCGLNRSIRYPRGG